MIVDLTGGVRSHSSVMKEMPDPTQYILSSFSNIAVSIDARYRFPTCEQQCMNLSICILDGKPRRHKVVDMTSVKREVIN